MMRRLYFLTVILSLSLASAQTSNPMDYLIPPVQDLSIKFLTDIFGSVGGVLIGPETITGILFEIFNLGILAIAMYLLAYTITFNLVNEIGSGQPLAHQYDIFTVSRVVVGNAFLLPSYGGYSFIQVLVMQVAVYGVGLADSIWEVAVNNLTTYGGATAPAIETQDEATLVNTLLTNNNSINASTASAINQLATVELLWQMTVCAETQYRHDAILNKSSVNRADYAWQIKDNQATTGKTVQGKNCGAVTLNTGGLDNQGIMAAENSFYTTVLNLQGYAESLYESTLSRDPSLWYEILACAPDGQSSNCEQGPELSQITSFYYSALKPFALEDPEEPTDDASDISAYMNQGWAAGSFYITELIEPDANNSAVSTQSVSRTKLQSLLYKISAPITYRSNSDTIYNDASQIYWILSQCPNEGSCGEPPYGLTDSQTVSSPWKITSLDYINPASSIIMDTYLDNTSSSENCTGNRYMDVASASLYQNWLRFDKTDSSDANNPFSAFNLDSTSILFANDAAAGFDKVFVGFNQRNLYVLLNKVMSDITGINYFSDMNQSSYDNVTHNPSIDSLSDKCGVSDVTGCFCEIASNSSLVQPGQGLMGAFVGSYNNAGGFETLNPIVLLKSMGLTIFKHSIDTIIQSIKDALAITKQLAIEYLNVMYTIMIPFQTFLLGLALFTDTAAQTSVFLNMVRVFFTVFQFLQLLDFQEMEVYRGILSTFTSITPLIGFTLGIYLPLIPALYYLFAILGWLIAVIEAMIAAPIIALGITYPKGHDLLGNSEQGIILLLQLFVRPLSIIFGLIAGFLLSSVIFQLFNYMMFGFLAGYASSFAEFGSQQRATLIGMALIVLAYAYIAIVIVSNSFSLIYRLPDRILRWIGAPMDPSNVTEMVNEVRRGVTDSMARGSRSASQTRAEVTSTDSSRLNIQRVETDYEKR